MNKRKAAHKSIDEAMSDVLRGLNRTNYRTEEAYILAVNACDKVYRPFLHFITDAEYDEIPEAEVTVAMVELVVSMVAQMAAHVVPEGDWPFARTWFGTVNQQIMQGNVDTCNAIFPEAAYINPGETIQ